MKPEIVVDVDAGAVDLLGAEGLQRLMRCYSVWLLTARGEHRFAELQAELSKRGIFPGSHYIGVTNIVWTRVKHILSPRAEKDAEVLLLVAGT
jgi:hypothetical protein